MEIDRSTVAVVTGACGGIGRATALALAARGSAVALLDVNEQRLAEVRAEVAATGVAATAHVCDVGDATAMAATAAEVEAAHGMVNLVVNNAGVTSLGPFAEEPLEDLEWLVRINTWGVVNGCRAYLPMLQRSTPAHIVNVSSMVALMGMPLNAAYAMSKGAVRSFSEGLRSELRSQGIGVTVVFPGSIDTGILESARGSRSAGMRARSASPAAARVRRAVLTSPETVARHIVRGVERNRARALAGPDARVLDVWSRIVPGRSGLVGRVVK